MLPKFIEECNRLLPDGAADGALRALHVSLKSASMRTVRQCLKRNNCPPSNSPNLNITEISCLGSDAQSYVETFIQIPKQFLNKKLHWRRYGTIFASQLIKLSRVLQIV